MACVMVKGAIERPEPIRTIDNPMRKNVKSPHGDYYAKLKELEVALVRRTRAFTQVADEYARQRHARLDTPLKPDREGRERAPSEPDFLSLGRTDMTCDVPVHAVGGFDGYVLRYCI